MSERTAARRLQRARAAIEERRLRVEPIGDRGAVRIRGPGVDVLIADLAQLDVASL